VVPASAVLLLQPCDAIIPTAPAPTASKESDLKSFIGDASSDYGTRANEERDLRGGPHGRPTAAHANEDELDGARPELRWKHEPPPGDEGLCLSRRQ
jgi:hypothetical protein